VIVPAENTCRRPSCRGLSTERVPTGDLPAGKNQRKWALLPILVIGIQLLGASDLMAQDWSIGVRIGMNASRLNFQDSQARSLALPTPGFHVGLIAALRIHESFSLQTEILYSRKGFDSDDEKLKLAYVEIPLLLAVHAPGSLSPKLFAGPVLGYEVGCRSLRVPGLGNLDCDHSLEGLQRKKVDAGIAMGAGLGVKAGLGDAFFDLWVTQGLRNISLEDRPAGFVRNQVLSMSAGYRYPLGGGS
jgi:hypothetical protein